MRSGQGKAHLLFCNDLVLSNRSVSSKMLWEVRIDSHDIWNCLICMCYEISMCVKATLSGGEIVFTTVFLHTPRLSS